MFKYTSIIFTHHKAVVKHVGCLTEPPGSSELQGYATLRYLLYMPSVNRSSSLSSSVSSPGYRLPRTAPLWQGLALSILLIIYSHIVRLQIYMVISITIVAE